MEITIMEITIMEITEIQIVLLDCLKTEEEDTSHSVNSDMKAIILQKL